MSKSTDTTAPKQRGRPFKPGKSGNPKGRPKGSRNKLSEGFLTELCADFDEHGAEVLATVREKDPSAYLRVAASLLPKQTEIEFKGDLEHLSDEQLAARKKVLEDKIESYKNGQ